MAFAQGIAAWWRRAWADDRPRYTIRYEPDKGYPGYWIVYERVFSDWLMPVTSRSSRESAEAWIADRLGTTGTETVT